MKIINRWKFVYEICELFCGQDKLSAAVLVAGYITKSCVQTYWFAVKICEKLILLNFPYFYLCICQRHYSLNNNFKLIGLKRRNSDSWDHSFHQKMYKILSVLWRYFSWLQVQWRKTFSWWVTQPIISFRFTISWIGAWNLSQRSSPTWLHTKRCVTKCRRKRRRKKESIKYYRFLLCLPYFFFDHPNNFQPRISKLFQ